MENDKNKPYTLTPEELALASEFAFTPKTETYKVNVDKIKTIKDIKLIFKHLDLHFTPKNEEQYKEMKHLLIIN